VENVTFQIVNKTEFMAFLDKNSFESQFCRSA
jgi:hypothetical protein